MLQQTAILFFHRAESQDLQAKRLEKRSVVKYLNLRTKKILTHTELQVFDYQDTNFTSLSIQQRFYHAVQSVFDAGYEKVIIVGNDCPLLQSKDLLQAATLLETNDLVLGPDHRGGAYLIGISKAAFSKNWAENLAWHSPEFLKSAIQKIESYSLLHALPDFNSKDEIQHLLKNEVRKHLLYPLLFLIKVETTFVLNPIFKNQIEWFTQGLRAPPAFTI